MPKLILNISLLFAFCSQAATIVAPEHINGLQIFPSKMESKTFDGLSGLAIPIKTSTKKGTVVVFLSAKCPCSNSHVPEIKKLSEQYADFQFVGVHSNADESYDITFIYFKSANLPFPILQDLNSELANKLKAYKTPHVFLINPKGELLYQGGVTSSANAAQADKHFLSDALEDVQLGKSVRVSEGRTLGCVIQREEDNKNVWK